MTDDLKQPLPVEGYTAQPDAKIALVNEFKQMEERLLRKTDELSRPPMPWHNVATGQYHSSADSSSPLATDPRWLAVAKTHFQEGFMALNRAVFQPQRIKLPEDES